MRALFGDLFSAHRAGGYDGPPRRNRFDADEAVRALRGFHDVHGHSPSVRDWDEFGQRPSTPPIIRHFGSWNAALSAAGLGARRHCRRWTDEEIVAAIRAFETCHRRPPATADFGGGTLPGFETVRVRFGSLAAVLERAGDGRSS